MEDILETEADHSRKRALIALINSFRAYFNLYDPDKPHENDGQVIALTSKDMLTASLIVTSPRGIGNMPTLNTVQSILDKAGITCGVDTAAIEQALQEIRRQKDIIWCLPIANGEPAQPASLGRLAFNVPLLDKEKMAENVADISTWLIPLWPPLEEGAIVATLTDSTPSSPGRNVFGKTIDPPESRLAIDIGEEIKLSNRNILTSAASGYLMADEARIDIVPVYQIKPSQAQMQRDFSFPGVVLVEDCLRGPATITCDDLIVLGNLEQVSVFCRGDIFVAGGIVGHNKTTIQADGRVVASFISETKVSALREVAAVNAIINSQVISNTVIRVLSDKGIIAGGKLYSLREISASTIGSEFGMLTETVVGKDFLSSSRMEEITNLIITHEKNLNRIQALKAQIVKSRVRLENMPRDKQEIYIGILQKEQNSIHELRSLTRRKKTLNRGLQDFLDATIQVMDSLYPPVLVQIGNAIREIREKLNAVTLKFDDSLGIISQNQAKPSKNGETTNGAV